MALRKILTEGDEQLLKHSRKVEKFDDRLHTLIDDMRETLENSGGVGLAAKAYGMQRLLLEKALQIVSDCPCEQGCPSCAGPVGEIGTDGKATSKLLLKELISCP